MGCTTTTSQTITEWRTCGGEPFLIIYTTLSATESMLVPRKPTVPMGTSIPRRIRTVIPMVAANVEYVNVPRQMSVAKNVLVVFVNGTRLSANHECAAVVVAVICWATSAFATHFVVEVGVAVTVCVTSAV